MHEVLCDGISHVGRLLTHRRRINCSRIRPWLQAKAEDDPVLRFDMLAAWDPDNSLSMHSRFSNLAQLASAHLLYVKFRLQVDSICTKCFATVSHTWGLFSLTPEELREVEDAHVCKIKGRRSPDIQSAPPRPQRRPATRRSDSSVPRDQACFRDATDDVGRPHCTRPSMPRAPLFIVRTASLSWSVAIPRGAFGLS